MKKVLQICSYYYGTKLYKNLMDNLINNQVELDVFAPCSYKYEYNGSEKYLLKVKCFNNMDRLLFYYKYNKIYDSLLKNVDINHYNLLHAHSLFANGYIAYKIFKQYNIPYIVAVRNTDINVFFKYFINLRKLGIQILENATKIIFISNSYKNKVIDRYIPNNKKKTIEEKSVVIPNGIDDYFFINKSSPKKIDKNNLNLVFTGRVDSNKNLITTIKCCDKILKTKYNVTLNVIGKIPSKRYKRIIKKYKFINYLGTKNKDELVKIYKDMDIYVMPSKHETFGLTYVEAMSQGLPVIYTKNEGFDKFFEEGKIGFHMVYNDYNEMAQNIEKIIMNYEEISKNCINSSLEFNWNDISIEYKKIYTSIIENKSK